MIFKNIIICNNINSLIAKFYNNNFTSDRHYKPIKPL